MGRGLPGPPPHGGSPTLQRSRTRISVLKSTKIIHSRGLHREVYLCTPHHALYQPSHCSNLTGPGAGPRDSAVSVAFGTLHGHRGKGRSLRNGRGTCFGDLIPLTPPPPRDTENEGEGGAATMGVPENAVCERMDFLNIFRCCKNQRNTQDTLAAPGPSPTHGSERYRDLTSLFY